MGVEGRGERYIVGSWQRGIRMMSRCVFGCGGSGDLVLHIEISNAAFMCVFALARLH